MNSIKQGDEVMKIKDCYCGGVGVASFRKWFVKTGVVECKECDLSISGSDVEGAIKNWNSLMSKLERCDELQRRMEAGSDYLMTVSKSEISARGALEAFGFKYVLSKPKSEQETLYDWENVPPEIMWIATDSFHFGSDNQAVFGYVGEPSKEDGAGIWWPADDGQEKSMAEYTNSASCDWKDSLEHRPEDK